MVRWRGFFTGCIASFSWKWYLSYGKFFAAMLFGRLSSDIEVNDNLKCSVWKARHGMGSTSLLWTHTARNQPRHHVCVWLSSPNRLINQQQHQPAQQTEMDFITVKRVLESKEKWGKPSSRTAGERNARAAKADTVWLVKTDWEFGMEERRNRQPTTKVKGLRW
jgi:hypothetical protein